MFAGSLLVAIALTASAHAAGGRGGGGPSTDILLDVPYVPQTEALCGGAAVTMALRYWGADVGMAQFEPLVTPDGLGIRTTDLHDATEGLGWQVSSFAGDAGTIVEHISNGRPLIALIAVAGGRFHYVTVVGVIGDQVVYHDPAVSPFQMRDMDDFVRDWSLGSYWTMLVLPPEGGVPEGPVDEVGPARPSEAAAAGPDAFAALESRLGAECAALLEEGIELARAGDVETARIALFAAATGCPAAAPPARELAALELREGRAEEAVVLAERAVGLDDTDLHAWEILAAAYYLTGDEVNSLAAWNRLGPMVLDEVTIGSTSRTHQTVILGLAGLEAGDLLTAPGLVRARRQLDLLPAASSTRFDYEPLGDGHAIATAAISERAAIPSLASLAITTGKGLLTDTGIGIRSATGIGAGELWAADYRWIDPRRRLEVSMRVPVMAPLRGTLRVGGLSARETYLFGFASGPVDDLAVETQENRRRADVELLTWLSPRVRARTTVAYDRFEDIGTFGALGAEMLFVGLGDRMSLRLGAEGWAGNARSFGRTDAQLDWVSSPETSGLVFSARLGGALVSEASPNMVWAGAGTGSGREVLARAHPLLTNSRFNGSLFGRTLGFGGVQATWWTTRTLFQLVDLGFAGFLDHAAVWDRPAPYAGTDVQTDVGVGLRLAVPGQGSIRADFGYGLGDGSTALSAGLEVGIGGG